MRLCDVSGFRFAVLLQLEKLIAKNYFLHMSAKEAFKAYVRAYDSHQLKTIFDIQTLDLAKVALSFGFKVPPSVDLSQYTTPNWADFFIFLSSDR